MIRRTLVLCGAAFVAVLLFATAASAQYPNDDACFVSDSNPNAGDSIVVSGQADPGAALTVTLTQGGNTVVVGQTTADATGHFSITVTIPDGFTAGPATLDCGAGVSVAINIGGATVATLPRTGSSNSLPMARIAVVLLAAGGFLVLTARKRAARVSIDT